MRNKPVLGLGLAFFMDAFIELDTDRDIGFGLGPIPWSSMHTYAMAHGLTGEIYHDFMYLVRKLDTAYIKHRQAKEGNNG